MSNSNGYGVNIGFQFTSFETVNKNFQDILKRLSDTGNVNLQLGFDKSKLDSIREEFNKVVNQKVVFDTADASTQITTLKNSANELLTITKMFNNQGEQQGEATYALSSKANIEAQVNLYKLLNQLQQTEFNLKKQIIASDGEHLNELNRQLEANKQLQQLTGKSINGNLLSDEKLNNDLIQKRIDLQNKYNLSVSQVTDKNNNFQIQAEIKVWEQYEAQLKKVNDLKLKLTQDTNISKSNGALNNSTYDNLLNQINKLNVNSPKDTIDRITESVNNLGNSSNRVIRLNDEITKFKTSLNDIKSNSSSALNLGDNVNKLETFNQSMNDADSTLNKLKKNSQSVTMAEFNKALLDLRNSFSDLDNGVKSIDNVQTKLKTLQETLSTLNSNGLYDSNFIQKLQLDFNSFNINTPIEKINEFENYLKSLGSNESGILQLTNQLNNFENKLSNLETQNVGKNILPTTELSAFKTILSSLQEQLNSMKNGDVINGTKLKGNIQEATSAYRDLTSAVKANSEAQKQENAEMVSFGDGIRHVVSQVGMFVGAYQIIYGLANAFKEVISTVIDMDTAMADLNKVVDLTSQQLEYMTQKAEEMGKAYGISVTEVGQAQAEFGRLYKDTQSINELTQASLLGSNVMDDSTPAQVAKSLTTIMTAMKMNVSDTMTILDSMNEIQNNFRVSSDTLSSSLSQVASTAYMSGASLQSVEGYITAIAQATGKVTIY